MLGAIIFLILNVKKILNTLFGLLILTACSSAGESATPVAITPSLQPTVTAVKVLPTSSSPGNSIIWQGLQVTMAQAELTEDFITDFGTIRIPSAGEKFMWVHVQLKNLEENDIETPLPEHFSVLYAALELKPTYGHRKDYADYIALAPVIFPNQEVDAWLRLDVPDTAELKDLRFVFIPESSQVGSSFSSPNYPYAEGRATFVWNCAP